MFWEKAFCMLSSSMKRSRPLCPDQPQTEDRNLRKHREEGVIVPEWQHQPKREEEYEHRAPGDGSRAGKGHY